MTRPTPPPPPPRAAPAAEELDRISARRILAQMGENGKPPELGIAHVNAGNESYLRVIDSVYIQDLICVAEGSSFKLVQGTYGAGKTHFLYCVRDLAWRRRLLTAVVTISPKECPFNRPLAVYRAVAQRLEQPAGADGEAVRGVDDLIRRGVEQRVADEGRDEARRWVDGLGRAQLTRHAFRDAVVGFARAVLDGDEPGARRLGAWLRGEDVSLTEAKAAGVYEVPSNENGFGMLRSLVQLVPRLGWQGSVLLLDEAERRVSADDKPTKALGETVDHLRELIDLCGRSELPRTLILYAVTPMFTEHVLPLYPALQQRLGAPIQFLGANNPKAPVIDLEALDLEPRKLLLEVGARLAAVARLAYDWTPQDRIVQTNLERLAAIVTEEQLEVGHRRFFVRLWVRLLDQLRLGKSKVLSDDDLRSLVRDEQALVTEEVDEALVNTFFGIPYLARPLKKR
ncbi:MAG TPA: BREX system ATP-binding domain-containing protein [Kofleriaceae bacterium]|nr:BREX system ATP-binding domain-containing protein [Kofleriaceae bacterium]